MLRVSLAGLGVCFVLWSVETTFGFPANVLPVDPSLWWFLGGAAIGTRSAVAVARYRWAAAVVIPAALVFTAWCMAFFAAKVRPTEWTYPPPPFGYAGGALIILCATLPIAVSIAATVWHLGWTRKPWIVAVVVISAPFVTIAVLNLYDFAQFRLALRRANGLDERQLAALADHCAQITDNKRYAKGQCPVEFASLQPEFVSESRGLAYASLYSRGHVYVEFRVESQQGRPRIYYFTNSDGPQKTVLLGRQPNVALTRPQWPARIVTLREIAMHPQPTWIVFPDRIQVIGIPEGGREVAILAEVPLTESDRTEIERVAKFARRLIG